MADRAVLQLAKRYGFTLARQTTHLVFKHPDGRQVVTSATCTHWLPHHALPLPLRQILMAPEVEA